MQSTLIVAGVVFVGAAIVGGGMVAFKVEVPLIHSLTRQVMLGVFGLALLITGMVTGEGDSPARESPADNADVSTTAVRDTSTSMPDETTTSGGSPTTSAREPAAVEERQWVLVLDDEGELGITIPSDWTLTVTADAIWASAANIDEWVAATNGDGPALHNGYVIRRYMQPVVGTAGTFEDIGEEFLNQMPVPAQCAQVGSDTERPVPGTYFTYRIYECAPGGEYINEVEIGFNPPWVTTESSRYLTDRDRENILDRIWESVRSY